MPLFSRIKERLGFGAPVDDYAEEYEDDFVEIDTKKDIGNRSKIIVRSFVLTEFADVKDALDALREGYTIALINIKPLRDKDMVELKRAIEKIKKTCDALEGDLAGVSENFIVVTPSFAHIYRNVETEEVKA